MNLGSHSPHLIVSPRPHERWWGGRTVDGHRAPFGDGRVFRVDLRHTGGNHAMPMLLSSHGRVVWSTDPFSVEFDGEGRLHTGPCDPPLIDATLPRLIETGSTLREAFAWASRHAFKPDGCEPDPRLFSGPQYNLWIELLYEPTQAKVLAYARRLLDEGYPPRGHHDR